MPTLGGAGATTSQPAVPSLDTATLDHVLRLLTDRLNVVVTYGAGGCPTCHDVVRGLIPPARKRHAEITRDLADARRLTLAAINGRVALEQDVAALKDQVHELDQRLQAVEQQLLQVG